MTFVSLMILVGIQISWVLKSARMQEAQFNHTVTLALNRTVENLNGNQSICREMSNCLREGKAHSCSLIMKNRNEWLNLESLIRNDLKYYNIDLDFEFDIVEKGIVETSAAHNNFYINDNLEKALQQSGYELRVRFPEKKDFIKAQIGYIFISSIALLLLVSLSFALIYKYFKRERKLTSNIIDFINNMTHEFKTPLTNIALANSMISKNEAVGKDEKLTAFTGVIRNEHQRLREKVDILLKAAMSETDKPFTIEQFNALNEIRNVAGTFHIRLKEANGSFVIEETGRNFIVSGNTEMFNIAIGNLIDNSISYNRETPHISIRLVSGEKSLSIEISDNGIGISKDNLPHIFDKFYRVTEGAIHNSDGFGLGLYYVKKTITSMNGIINVNSLPGKGTSFIIHLPLSEV